MPEKPFLNTLNEISSTDKKRKALVMTLTYPSADPRPLRYIRYLASRNFQVDLFSYPFDQRKEESVSFHHEIKRHQYDLLSKIIRNLHKRTPVLTTLLPLNSLKDFLITSRHLLNSYIRLLKSETYDLLIVQDILLLPLAFKVKNEAKVIFDAREYYPAQNEESLFFRMFEKPERDSLCRTYLPNCDGLVTVSGGLKERYDREFGVNFTVLRSVPNYSKLKVSQVKKDQFRMVHHGAALRNRQLEKMIEITNRLNARFVLDLYLKGDSGYIKELEELIKDEPKIQLIDPVPFEKIINTLNRYDIGLFYVEPTTFNLKHCLPNKLFEFIQARLMVAIGPSPDMSKIVYGYECGVVSNKFTVESMVEVLSKISADEIIKYKQNSHKAASILCFEKEQTVLDTMIEKLIPVHE